MKTFVSIVAATCLFGSFGWADAPLKAHEQNQVKNEIQNRFKTMGTDELLQQRGSLHSQQEREQLHNELMNREKTMTKEQKEKFGHAPEKMSQEMGSQGKGMGYGQGQGMMQGQHKGMMDGQHKGMMQQGRGGGMGGGKGGR